MSTTPVELTFGRTRRMSFAQRPLFVSQHLHPQSPLQNMALVSHFQRDVDRERLAAAFAAVVQASDVLRSRIVGNDAADSVSADSGSTRGAASRSSFEIHVGSVVQRSSFIELSHKELPAWAANRAKQPLDIANCAYDSVIVEHEDGSTSWYLNLHHTVTDATSSALVFAATASAYEGQQVSFDSYYDWSDGLDLASNKAKRASKHWAQRPAASRIGHLYAPPSGVNSGESSRVGFDDDALIREVQASLASDFTALSDDLAWTTVLLTALSVFLHKVTLADEFAIGLPVHNRNDPKADSLIGPVMEVFPVDISVSADATFRSLHRNVGKAAMKTLANAVPGTAPQADCEAVVNVILRAGISTFGTTPVTTSWLDTEAIDSGHLLRLQLTRYGDQATPQLQADINHSVADADHRARFWRHFSAILDAMVSRPDMPVGELCLIDDSEAAILSAWEKRPEEPVLPIIARLRSSLHNNDNIVLEDAALKDAALEDGRRTWTGSELWRDVTAGSSHLQSLGMKPGDRVGIELPRSGETVVAILAVLCLGASYVPLDPSDTRQRRSKLIERAGCAHVISDPLPTTTSGLTVAAGQVIDRPDTEAYLLFTSGSSGEAKGVPITQAGLSRYLSFALASYASDGAAPVVPLFTSLGFDLTVTSLFLPLLTAGKLVVIPETGTPALQKVAERTDINWLKATPSHLELLLRLLPAEHSLQTLVVGGEAFTTSLAERLYNWKPELAIYNEYGPTEAVVGCMIHRCTKVEVEQFADVPIGVPVPGVSLRIVDRHLQRMPIGSLGELLISHPGVTRGYLGDLDREVESGAQQESDLDAATAAAFVVLDGERYYRSGDLVRLVDDSKAVYLGRIDEQIKVGGIRLDPAEVEAALESHAGVERAVVRLWSPKTVAAEAFCSRCGLPGNVPGVTFDDAGVCMTCRDYERVAPIAESWFKTPVDLLAKRDAAQRRKAGAYDCLLLLSGGKDSTFALYKLVELGFRPYALTLDNGFISEEAKDNVRRSVNDLGLDHEFATSDSMNEVFRESLKQFSNVCHGCYKTIYSIATQRAVELGIPMIVTGLSRGQLFETRLLPEQFDEARFDPAAIDKAVIEARKNYHRSDDKINRLLDTSVFDRETIFDEVEYLDIYRYLDVELEEMLSFLAHQAPWVRPADTGRSTNCLINAAGIYTHLQEQGYHNYAVPYAWDVRLGHKTRAEAMAELHDGLDIQQVGQMLAEVGYEPQQRSILTAWVEPSASNGVPEPSELADHVGRRLATHAVPSAFVAVDQMPTTVNGKLDIAALPAPKRLHRRGPTVYVSATTEVERQIVEVFERVLRLQPVGVDDNFFALGGDSMAALEAATLLEDFLRRSIADAIVFMHPTARTLAAAIELAESDSTMPSGVGSRMAESLEIVSSGPKASAAAWFVDLDEASGAPGFSEAEKGILFDVAMEPTSIKYNLGRRYVFDGLLDHDSLRSALERVALRHRSLHWTYGTPRRRLLASEAVEFVVAAPLETPRDLWALDERVAHVHRQPFDLEGGPLLRCWLQPLTSADKPKTVVVLSLHHVSADSETFAIIWDEIAALVSGEPLPQLKELYNETPEHHDSALQSRVAVEQETSDSQFWLQAAAKSPARLGLESATEGAADGFIRMQASCTAADLTENRRATGFVLATAAAAMVVDRYSVGVAADSLGLGVLASARSSPLAPVAGYFLNTLPVGFPSDKNRTVGQTIEHARGTTAAALSHRFYPYAAMVRDRRAAGLVERPFDVLVAYDQLRSVTAPGTAGGMIEGSQEVLSNGSAVGPASLFVEVGAGVVDLAIEYSGSVMTPADAQRLLADFNAVLSAVALGDLNLRQADVALGSKSSVAVGESLAVAAQRSPLTASIVDSGSVWLAIAAHVSNDGPAVVAGTLPAWQASSGAVAIECGARRLSWSGVDVLSAAYAARLTAAGVLAGDRVIVSLPRSAMLLPAIVAVARLGATYVPIDPTYPAARRKELATSAKATAALVPSSSPDAGLPSGPLTANDVAIDLDSIDVDRRATPDASWHSNAFDPEHLAYIIFTSGSTGQAKGVGVPNRCLAASVAGRFDFYAKHGPARLTLADKVKAQQPARFAMLSSISFDSSIAGLFWTAASGGTLVLPTDSQVHDIDALGTLFARGSISHTLLVPTLYEAILARSVANASAADRQNERGAWPDNVIVAGEQCSRSVVSMHYGAHGDSVLWNEYGPTEATVWSSAALLEIDDLVSIGSPIAGTTLAVLDNALQPVPEGVVGQLAIGGPGVVGSYLDADAGSSEKFTALPWADRVFLTGDLAVMRDEQVRFLGRIDAQLNVAGVRVEPEEIESVLIALPGVAAAVVCLADVERRSTLVAHLEISDSSSRSGSDTLSSSDTLSDSGNLSDAARPLDVAALRYGISKQLNSALIPQRFVMHRRLPRLANGKIDRAAAQQLEYLETGPSPLDQASKTATSQTLPSQNLPSQNLPSQSLRSETVDPDLTVGVCAVFAEVLQHGEFEPDESFFDVGGHSLLAVQLVDNVESKFGVELPISTLYRNPTPVSVASFIAAAQAGSASITSTAVEATDAKSDSHQKKAHEVSDPEIQPLTYLVPIQPNGDKTPIIGVHVLGINSEFYRPLSARLGENQPVFGVGQPVANLETSAPSDVRGIAAAYAAELEPLTTAGPVILAAVSLGGVVAFELAVQLRRAGCVVEKLILFDAAGPDSLPSTEQSPADTAAHVLAKARAHRTELSKNPAKYVTDRSRMVGKRVRRRQEVASIQLRQRLGLQLNDRLDIRRFVEENVKSQLSYKFEPLDVPLLVFKADDTFTDNLRSDSFGWRSVAAGGLELVDVPGGHLSILAEPHVGLVAEHCQSAVEAVASQHFDSQSVDSETVESQPSRRSLLEGGDGLLGGAQDSPRPASKVEAQLIDGLHAADFLQVLRRLREQLEDPENPFRFTVEDRKLIENVEHATSEIGDAARSAQARVMAALDGLRPVAQPVPKRLLHHTFTVSLSADIDEASVVELVAAMRSEGFEPQQFLGEAEVSQSIDRGLLILVAADIYATRAMIRWSPPARFGDAEVTDAEQVTGVADLGVFVGTPSALVSGVLAAASPSSDDVVLDLGSGDGRVLIEAASAFGCGGIGVEQSAELVDLSRSKIRDAGYSDAIHIVHGDARSVALDDATIIFLFLPPAVACELLPDLLARRPEGATIVAHEQLLVEWPVAPSEQRLVIADGVTVAYTWF